MSERKSATKFTEQSNKALYDTLNWEDTTDFELASRGHIASLDEPIIRNLEGRPVWDLTPYTFLDEKVAAPTVNPSLWRQAQLNMFHGLFKVTDRIYQVRGHDLSVMSIIEGDSGFIVIDPLISAETAKASMDLVYKHIGQKPIVVVIYTHSHIDHWGGVKGIISEEDVKTGKVQVIASEGFMEAAISENVLAGNAMSRRTVYHVGTVIPKDAQGQVDTGLGKGGSTGSVTLIEPTIIIGNTPTEMTLDGIEIIFQYTPETEAPTEMNFYFPQFKALCMAENCTHNLHNLYTLRGAEVRNTKSWVYHINEAIELFADKTDVIFASHHWPTWGQEACLDLLKKQRDMYRYLHDETLRLINHGYTMLEIAEMIELPGDLAQAWYNRGYYGSVNHNAKAVYQRYLGWFDGNPANLHALPPEDASKNYVAFMGGADAVLAKAHESYDRGEYRWVAQVVNHVVFADPNNQAARKLQADALEQLGYQAESGSWRNFYLVGAQELRQGILDLPAPHSGSPDVVKAMGLDLFFDFLAVRLNGPKAAGKTIIINADFTEINEQYVLTMENGVLNYSINKQDENADATIALTRTALNEIVLGEAALPDKLASGEVKISGDQSKLNELLSLLDTFEFWFNIVTP
ncbi:MAG: alkyl sulfatase dimerization domain-containing protein [Anaerolineales bacterium]